MTEPGPETEPSLPSDVRETHVSVVFFVGDRVYKLKKPVALDFLDFSTRARREQACHREVELNRRLAPDVYLGVLDVLDAEGRPRDHLVEMRRMPDARRLASLVSTGVDVDQCLRETARVVAAFHSRADTSPDVAHQGRVGSVRGRWESNFVTMRPLLAPTGLDPAIAAAVETMAARYLDGRERLFEQRIADGKIRDGHGDLLADDIFCLDDGPRILDCIEFDDALRYGDVLADVAFLAMDLERLGNADLGARFLGWYREFSAETYPESLAHHYVAYRADVRAKVACLRVAQGDTAARETAGRLLHLAHDHLRRSRISLTLVGGLPGTGKSTLASGLADDRGWTVLHSDEVRKDLAGLGHTARRGDGYREGLYDERATAATYDALLTRARVLLGLGESVVLDASWTDERQRIAARALAHDTASDLVELACRTPINVARLRLEARGRAGTDASDATGVIADHMAASADPWPSATTIDTSTSPEEALAAAIARL
jgi:aminoglycoside phosphotransferase family enzyme/predicted kinase